MIQASGARQSSLDEIADGTVPSIGLADGLFAVVDLLEAESGLRNALSDPTASVDARRQLASDIMAGRVADDAATIVYQAVALRWESGFALVDACERQGERALFRDALARGVLERVEDELFRFSRVVVGDDELQAVLDDRQVDLARREALVGDLLKDKDVDAVTMALAKRAVAARRGTNVSTIESMLALAAEVQQRTIAHVTVAAPLDATQTARLQAALAAQAGRPVTLEVAIDPSVLGGVRVLIGDDMIDGTISGRLAAAKRQLN